MKLYLEERIALARRALNEKSPAVLDVALCSDSDRALIEQFIWDVMSVLDGVDDGAMQRLGLKRKGRKP